MIICVGKYKEIVLTFKIKIWSIGNNMNRICLGELKLVILVEFMFVMLKLKFVLEIVKKLIFFFKLKLKIYFTNF